VSGCRSAVCLGSTCGSDAAARILRRAALREDGRREAPGIVHRALAEPGRPLEPGVLGAMESSFDHDFSAVRVHTGPTAEASAAAVSARAYTVGSHIVLGRGETVAGSGGRRLLAHELTHVVQQRPHGPAPDRRIRIGPPGDAAEQAAQQVSSRVAAGDHAGAALNESASGSAAGSLQREPLRSTAGPAGVPAEKWSEASESAFLKTGELEMARAIRACRTMGAEYCGNILTDYETWAAFAAGGDLAAAELAERQVAGPPPPGAQLQRTGFVGTMAGGGGGESILEAGRAALANPAVRQFAMSVVLRIPIAIIVAIFVLAAIEAVKFARFVGELRKMGYVVLGSVLGACIQGCHMAGSAARRLRDFPDFEPITLGRTAARPWPLTPVTPDVSDYFKPGRVRPLEPWKPAPRPVPETQPEPQPKPAPRPPRVEPELPPKPGRAPDPAPKPEPGPRVYPVPPVSGRVDPDRDRKRRNLRYPLCWPVFLGPPRSLYFMRIKGAPRDDDETKQARMALEWRQFRDPTFDPKLYHVHHVDPLFLGGPDDLRGNGTVLWRTPHLRGHAQLKQQPQMLTPPPGLPPLPKDIYKHPHGTPYVLAGFKTSEEQTCR
jgi:Domain of unknown function (DUF4157)